MANELRLADVTLWRTRLGLLPVPLFREKGQTYVLLNGSRGNFCLDLQCLPIGDEARSYAWSSNVGHYVALVDDHVEVQRWDQRRASIERYSKISVQENLEKFHEYIEKDTPRQELSVISHSIRVFRSLRATLGRGYDGVTSLEAFLYLIACAADGLERGRVRLADWRLRQEAADVVSEIREGDWATLQSDLTQGRAIEGLVPNLELLLRHASGQLFQEAHYEALFVPQEKMALDGFLPAPVRIAKQKGGAGVHFTPPALARTVVEEAFSGLDPMPASMVILDPACGSGEFLRESLRQLELAEYKGDVKLIGWDVSRAACDMAGFILSWECSGSSINADVEIRCVDSLDPSQQWPESVDLVLMNPPFVSWQGMGRPQQEAVMQTLQGLGRQRPDMSYAFIWKAMLCLRKGGILGTVMPASFLSAQSAERVRFHLAQQMTPKLIAHLGSHFLFPGAIVDAALYVASKGDESRWPTVAFWASHRASSAFAGLRTLRRVRDYGEQRSLPALGEDFSIYINDVIGRGSEDWAPRPYESWRLRQSTEQLPRVRDLFDVSQGARTGHNEAFLLTKALWEDLPHNERGYFRPAVVNESIRHGVLQDSVYCFYPYGERSIASEEQLADSLAQYYRKYLLPEKSRLLIRSGVRTDKWWELSSHRAWLVDPTPKLVSTYFGNAGSFAWDETGSFVVVQGYAWLPKGRKRSLLLSRELALAYLAILSSPLFAQLLPAVSNHVGGGQWDLSTRFMSNMPIPDLFISDVDADAIYRLADFGRQISQGLAVDEKALDGYVRAIYGIERY